MSHRHLGGRAPHVGHLVPFKTTNLHGAAPPEPAKPGDWRPGSVISDADDLGQLWQTLISPGRFVRRRSGAEELGFGTEPVTRTLWLALLDADHRALPTVFPIDNIPAEPDPAVLGALGDIIGSMVAEGFAASMPVLLERSGRPGMTEADRRWARATRRTLGAAACRWPVHLATSAGIRPFAPDDLLVGSG